MVSDDESRVHRLETFTFSPDIARALFDEPLTDEAAAAFELAAMEGDGGA